MKRRYPFGGIRGSVVTLSLGLMVGSHLGIADEAAADRPASVRYATRAGISNPRHPANPRGVADPRGPLDPRGPADPRGVADPRGPLDPRGPYDPRGPLDPRGPYDPRNPRGRSYHYARYEAWDDAWDDYRRWRTVTGIIKLGAYYATLPEDTTEVVVSGSPYYYSGGVYYQKSGNGYVVVPAPTGAVVSAVPSYTTVSYVGSTPYYYSNGTYYVASSAPAGTPVSSQVSQTAAASTNRAPEAPEMTEDDHNYEVVAPPVGATVPYLPEGADRRTISGKTFYVYGDTYYQPFASGDDTIYMVVEDPRQAG